MCDSDVEERKDRYFLALHFGAGHNPTSVTVKHKRLAKSILSEAVALISENRGTRACDVVTFILRKLEVRKDQIQMRPHDISHCVGFGLGKCWLWIEFEP